MPQLDISFYIPQLFWLCVFFLILWAGLHFFLAPRFRKIFKKRAAQIDEKLKEIEILKEKDAQLARQMEELKKEAAERVQFILHEAEQKAAAQIQALKEKNHKLLLNEVQDFEKQLQEETPKILASVSSEKIEMLAKELLKKLN